MLLQMRTEVHKTAAGRCLHATFLHYSNFCYSLTLMNTESIRTSFFFLKKKKWEVQILTPEILETGISSFLLVAIRLAQIGMS